MLVHEIDKDNWTGEKFKLKVRKDGTFDIYDYTFKVVVKGTEFQTAKLMVKEKGGWREVAQGFNLMDGDGWSFTYGDISREAQIVEVAAAQLDFNIF